MPKKCFWTPDHGGETRGDDKDTTFLVDWSADPKFAPGGRYYDGQPRTGQARLIDSESEWEEWKPDDKDDGDDDDDDDGGGGPPRRRRRRDDRDPPPPKAKLSRRVDVSSAR